jgi:hypothetical protein
VKFAAALVGLVEFDLIAMEPVRGVQSAVGIEAALSGLTTVQRVLGEVITALGGAGDAGHYADGRSIASQVRFGEGTRYVYPGHPDPASPANKLHEIATVTTRNGTRKQVIVGAPRHLDSVRICQGEINDAARDWLRDEATRLRSIPCESGTILDVAGNCD